MQALIQPSSLVALKRTHFFFDDFDRKAIDSTNDYSFTTAVDGTVALSDAKDGVAVITSAVASVGDNEDAYLNQEMESWLIAADKPLKFGAAVKYTEVSTNTVNAIVGMTDAVAANLLVNDGAGPKTSGSTICFFKKDGGLNWWVHVSIGSTQTSVELTAANSLSKLAYVAASSTFQLLEFEVFPKTTTLADVIFYIDGTPVYKITDWTFTSATEMQMVCGVKNGTTSACAISLDYWYAEQTRG